MEPYNNPFWGFEQQWRQEEEEQKIKLPKIVAYLSCFAGRTQFARTNKDISYNSTKCETIKRLDILFEYAISVMKLDNGICIESAWPKLITFIGSQTTTNCYHR